LEKIIAMEKKHKYLSFALILGVIVLFHLIVVKLLFSENENTPIPASDPSAQVHEQLQDKNRIVPVAAKAFRLNYRYANRDKIPGLLTAEATSGILADMDSGYVLWEKNSRQPVPIASMTKMMTLLVAFEELEQRSDITLDTVITVSAKAERIGGTQVWLKKGEKFTLRDLMKTMMLRSANDSAYLVAEYFGGGDVNRFVAKMNRRAVELNMSGTKFYNSNGLPEVKNNTSAPEGLARMAFELLRRPQIVKWSSSRKDSFRDKSSKAYQILVNTNKLVNTCPGVDGMKTGYIKASGSCITITCKRGGRRLIAAVTGFKGWRSRNAFMRKLLDWGYKRSNEIELLDRKSTKKVFGTATK
jgi:serine-type D-Ala-D-Ala carboxypeptidase (penicillin-binding protein 5/6)